jgi:hypothetical protein
MTEFATAPAALPRLAPLDPTKHVKYTLGMVLGVDDFDQEFAYLSGRDQWLARDLCGYGTIWGLDVGVEVDATGPRVNVSPGTALTPCGRLVCVTPAQCAYINEWLAVHAGEVRDLLTTSPPGPPGSPPDLGLLTVWVVLCYRACETDDLPIPGEPCRSEDTLSAPSRIKDDFRLELRLARPRQREEDAIRDVVAWLRRIPVVLGGGSSVEALVEALRLAADAVLASPPDSPPAQADSPPSWPYDFVLDEPPPGLAIPADRITEYLRAAFGLWVTELRPRLRRDLPGCECGCDGAGTCGCGCAGHAGSHLERCDDDVVLLARIELALAQELDRDLVVADQGWLVDDVERPYVLHTRLLQEWMLSGPAVVEGGPIDTSPPSGPPISQVLAHQVTGAPTADFDAATRVLDLGIPSGAGIDDVQVTVLPPGSNPSVVSFGGGVLNLGLASGAQGQPGERGDSFVVAAGRFGPQGGPVWSFNNLKAIRVTGMPGVFFLTFDTYDRGRDYAITGAPWITLDDDDGAPTRTFELVVPGDRLQAALANMGEDIDRGFCVRVVADDLRSEARGFNVEVSDYTDVTP